MVQSGWRRGCQCFVCGGGLLQEVGGVVVAECHCVPFGRLCCTISTVCGLPVVGQNLLENGMFWPLPSGAASGLLNAHFRL